MVSLKRLVSFLDQELNINLYQDSSLNGLQVQAQVSDDSEINRVGLAVDSGVGVLEEAVAQGCDLLLVHHGIFWGKEAPLRGVLGDQIRTLVTGGCSLYAAHLPLDGHPQLGNAAQLAELFELQEIQGFLNYGGAPVGLKGRIREGLTLEQLSSRLATLPGSITPTILPFGPSTVTELAIVTGSGSSALTQCALEGVSTLISGEGKQESYHLARDLGLNAIFAGHYATETVGVRAVGKLLKEKFAIETLFIDHPTGF